MRGRDREPSSTIQTTTSSGQSLRINVDTGATISDGSINGPAGAVITASAYTNSFAGTTTTQLFALDAATGTLYLQNPPNDGTLSTARLIGVTATGTSGFDIDPASNLGYAALAVGGTTRLYTFPLATGTATVVGTIGTGESLLGLALLANRPAPVAIALTSDSRLLTFNPAAPNTINSTVAISGLAGGETVLGIDYRPSNGRLYALTSSGRLLTVDPNTGLSTGGATLAADAADTTAPFTSIAAGNYSVDFNPVADRLRVISDTGTSLRINVDTGATTTDGNINRTSPATVIGAAYTNNFAGATTTRLLDIDAAQDVLAEQTPPNNGVLVDIGALGVNVAGRGSIDITGGDNGLVLAALSTTGGAPYSLYTVAIASGAATLYRNTSGNAALSQIGGAGGPVVVDIAIRY